jgi:hypothetical protein
VMRDLPFHDQDVQDTFETMWMHLRSASLFFLRFLEGQHTEEKILEAEGHVQEYSRLAEEVRSSSMHTNTAYAVFLHVHLWMFSFVP